jgi:hypothetical protein
VRIADSTCPFCGAAIALDESVLRRLLPAGLGRAALFTFGAAAIAAAPGCATSTTPTDAGSTSFDIGATGDLYGGPPHDMGVDAAAPDAGHDAAFAGMYGGPPPDAATDDAGEDAGIAAPYGAPPPPPEPER